MRIKNITLDNFRCFQHCKIDLSADVIAIHGRNGVGKTTIFDAIEFALLSSIGRFAGYPDPPNYLPHVLGDGKTSVRVDFDDNDMNWVQAVWENSEVFLDSSRGWRHHRNFLYQFLVNEDYAPPRQEVQPAADMFRSTILLSQDLINHFVTAKSEERVHVLSWLAGSAHYQKCWYKARQVAEEAQRRQRAKEEALLIKKGRVGELKSKLNEQDARISEVKEQLGTKPTLYNDVVSALQKAGLPVSWPSPTSSEVAREIAASARGTCMERLDLLAEQTNQLAALETILPQHSENQQRKRALLVMVADAKKEFRNLLDQENAATASLKRVERKIVDLNVRITEQSKQFKRLQQLPGLQQQQSELVKTKDIAKSKHETLQNKYAQETLELEKIQASLDRANSHALKLRDSQEKVSVHLKNLRSLKDSLPRYMSAKKKVKEIERQFQEASNQRKALEKQIGHGQKKQYELSKVLAEMEAKVARKRTSSNETRELISRLKERVTGSTCPLCGHDHSSSEALLKAISNRLNEVPLELQKAIEQLENTSNELSAINEELTRNQKELERFTELIASLQETKGKVQSEIHEIEVRATTLDVPLVNKTIDALINKNQRLLEEQTLKSRQAEEEVRNTERRFKEASLNVGSLKNGLAKQQRVYEDVQSKLNDLDVEIIELGLSDQIKLTSKQTAKLITEIESQLVKSEKEKSDCMDMKGKLQNELELSRHERAKVEKNLEEWQQTVLQLTERIEDFKSRCKRLELPPDTSDESISTYRRKLDKQRKELEEAIHITRQYETICRVTEMEKERDRIASQYKDECSQAENIKKAIAELVDAQEKGGTWTALLRKKVDDVVEQTIATHQPQIERFFKAMIPQPYLFERITMMRDREGLRLGLRYKGQEDDAGEPLFFLSLAQANVLALAIFLSLGIEGRWSKLDTLLLDDPVQHLDDLDAIAFLDCLRATALGKFGKRKQLIVSTCDQNLYLLMLRKFNLLRVENLTFTGISLLDKGIEGPEVHYDVGGPEYLSSAAKTG